MTAVAYQCRPSSTRDLGAFPTKRPAPTQTQTRYAAFMADYVTEFAELVSRWRAETALSATAREMMLAPSFSKLVSMNEKIIPLIIEELKRQPSFLFLLLHAITKENPVPQTAQGKIPEIVSAWLTWAARTRRDAA